MKQPIDAGTVGKRISSLSEPEKFKAIEAFEQAGNISVKEFAKAFQISEAPLYGNAPNWEISFDRIVCAGVTCHDAKVESK